MPLVLVNICMDEMLQKGSPFEVSVASFYSECNMECIKESIAQLNEGQTTTKTMEEL